MNAVTEIEINNIIDNLSLNVKEKIFRSHNEVKKIPMPKN